MASDSRIKRKASSRRGCNSTGVENWTDDAPIRIIGGEHATLTEEEKNERRRQFCDKMTYVKGTFYAFITAILYALVSIFSKILDERHKSIDFALLCAYVTLWIVFAPLRVIERHQEGRDEVGGEEKVKSGGTSDDVGIRHDESEGMQKKLRRHKMYDSYAFLPGLVGGNREHVESITTTTTFASTSPSSSAGVGVVADVEKGEKEPKKFSRYCCRPNKKTLALITMAFFDFIANYSAILCFKFTSVTSGTIIQTATVPISCTLGFLFMNRRYSRRHVGGAFVSMAALLFLIVCDSLEVNEEGKNVPHPDKNPVLGDVLAFSAAICFSVTNILQEYSIDSGVYQNEILAAFGFYGTLLAIVALFAEHNWNPNLLMDFFIRIEHHDVLIYVLTSVAFFASASSAYRALKYIDAGTFNVVLLQQSLLVGLVRLFGFDGGFSSTTQAGIFIGTFIVQAIGILVYATAGDVKHREETSGSESEKRSILAKR